MNMARLGRSLNDVVCENIRIEAARRGYTQSALARAIEMSQPAINQRWRGMTRWQLDELDAIARLFGVPVPYLVSDNAPVVPPTGLDPATS